MKRSPYLILVMLGSKAFALTPQYTPEEGGKPLEQLQLTAKNLEQEMNLIKKSVYRVEMGTGSGWSNCTGIAINESTLLTAKHCWPIKTTMVKIGQDKGDHTHKELGPSFDEITIYNSESPVWELPASSYTVNTGTTSTKYYTPAHSFIKLRVDESNYDIATVSFSDKPFANGHIESSLLETNESTITGLLIGELRSNTTGIRHWDLH
jgi:hypothetical protein